MRLALDHHYHPAIAEQLRKRGHDVVTAFEQGWHEFDDTALLDACVGQSRTVLTNNVDDFVGLAHEYLATGSTHHGIVLTSDLGYSRRVTGIGRLVNALDTLLRDNPAEDALLDQVRWL